VTDNLSTEGTTVSADSTASEGEAGGVWHEVLDPNTQHVYYWNQQDNITSWVLPRDATVVKLSGASDNGVYMFLCLYVTAWEKL